MSDYGSRNEALGPVCSDASNKILSSQIPTSGFTVPFSNIIGSETTASVSGNINPSTNYVIALTDVTLNLPLGSSVTKLTNYTVQNGGAVVTTIGVQGSDTINNVLTSIILNGQSSSITFTYSALASTWYIQSQNIVYVSVAVSTDFPMFGYQTMVIQSGDAKSIQLPDAIQTSDEVIYTIKLTGTAANATITVPPGQSLDGVVDGTYSIVATLNGVVSFRSRGTTQWFRVTN